MIDKEQGPTIMMIPVASIKEYMRLIPETEHAETRNTGYIGLVTNTSEFRNTVADAVTVPKREPRDAVRGPA